jgi:S-adenosylmethionine/arginine decarboxylase-like enzyme
MKAEIFNFQGWIGETSPLKVKTLMEGLLNKSGFTVLGKVEHAFEPAGFTAVWILAESHLAVHSFPEENKTYIEISSCNFAKNQAFASQIENILLQD